MSSENLRSWYVFIATVLILSIVGLAYLSLFKPGSTGEWNIKIGGMEFSGTNVALGFAAIILIILLKILPDLRRIMFDLPRIIGRFAIGIVRLFSRGRF